MFRFYCEYLHLLEFFKFLQGYPEFSFFLDGLHHVIADHIDSFLEEIHFGWFLKLVEVYLVFIGSIIFHDGRV